MKFDMDRTWAMLARTLQDGTRITTDDRPLQSTLRNRIGWLVCSYDLAGLPEWLVQFEDWKTAEVKTAIMHVKFLTVQP